MALVSDLVAAIAEVEGMPEATVALIARYAREAGFLSQGARGRNAPHATIADCANLLIAVNASGCVVKDAPKAIENYRRLVIHAPHGTRSVRADKTIYSSIDHDALRFLERREATFGEVLESIVERFVGGELETFMNDQALQYLTEEYLKKVVDESAGDMKAAAERIREQNESSLRLGIVRFELLFRRPNPFVKLDVVRENGGETESLAGAGFMVTVKDLESKRIVKGNSDRHDTTVIGYRTFMKIAEVMRK